ncbi:MAG: hypothetical protein A2017_00650 [Lentisphaerae bacterium GWF2_44_16]|nr:MAG: hypothetical protein A2017_00650 [Lentisphaerae bacterium GWF2_44_16]
MKKLEMLIVFTLIVFPWGLLASPREEINLRGIWHWQAAVGKDPEKIPGSGWKETEVPGDMRQYTKASHVWFQKEIEVPESWKGSVVKVFFGNVCRRALVYWNGEYVGCQEGGRLPFWLEIGPFVKFGGTNTLTVKVSDMSVYQAFPEEKISQRIKLASWNPGNSGYNRFEGIVGEVYLQKYPPIYIDDIYVKTSVLDKKLDICLTVKNTGDITEKLIVSIKVIDESKEILFPHNKDISINGKAENTFEFSEKWENPVLWNPDFPKLYSLRVELLDNKGKILDTKNTAFGFREFRVGRKELGEDPAFFYLNGKICKLRNTEISAYRGRGEDHSDLRLREKAFLRDFMAVKDANINMIRFFELADDWHYKICNEKGMMVAATITRCEPWQTLLVSDEKFNANKKLFQEYKKNMTEYVTRWIKYCRNNPSIVMWGLSNENLHFREYDSQIVEYLLGLEKTARKLDPTRPVYFSGDGDLYGQTEIITLHGVREIPGRSASPDKGILPNYAYFSELEEPRKFMSHRYFGLKGKSQWRWDCRKPIYFAEWPYTLEALVVSDAAPMFIGEDAFKKPLWKGVMQADAILMKAFIASARYLDFPSLGPFTITGASATPDAPTPISEECRRALMPQRAAVKEWDSCFYSNKEIPRTLSIYNDSYFKSVLELTWHFELCGRKISEGTEKCELEPGRFFRKVITLKMPEVLTRSEGIFSYQLRANGRTVFTDSHKISVFPLPGLLKDDSSIAVYDPEKSLNLPFRRLSDLDVINTEILIVANEKANEIKEKKVFLDFIKKGGKAFLLQQSKPNLDLLPAMFPCEPTISSSITFPAAAGHSILKGITPDDLKYWTGEGNDRHVVSRFNYIRPLLGNFKTIVVAGSRQLNVSPLLEFQYGQGLIIASQLELSSKFNIAPQADIIFRNVINYMKAYRPVWRKPKIVAAEGCNFVSGLKSIGIYAEIIGSATMLNPEEDIVLIDGQCDGISSFLPKKLKDFMVKGGIVYIWNTTASSVKTLLSEIGAEMRLISIGDKEYPLNRIADSKFIWGITSQELCWQKGSNTPDKEGEYVGGGCYIEPFYKGIIGSGISFSDGVELISGGGLSVCSIGKGTLVADQIDWVKGLSINYRSPALRYISSLLTNMGILIDLSKAGGRSVGISNWERKNDGREVNAHYPLRYINILNTLGLPFQMIGSKDLSEIASYGLVIIMNGLDKEKRGRGLTAKEASEIALFVKKGGGVLLEDNACIPQFMKGEFKPFYKFASGKITGIKFLNHDNPDLAEKTFKITLEPHFMTFMPGRDWDGKVLAYWEIDNKISNIPALLGGRYGKGNFAFISCKFYWLYQGIARENHEETHQINKIISKLLSGLYSNTENSKIKLENCSFIDLTNISNRSFSDEIAGDGKGGWTDQGPGNDLDSIPVGIQYLGRTPFKIIAQSQKGNNSCVVLKSPVNAANMPSSVMVEAGNIYAEKLHFLHTAAWLDEPEGKEVFFYRIMYGDNDGTTIKISVLNKKHIEDWYNYKPELELEDTEKISVFSDNKNHSLFSYEWINQRPDLPIQRIEIVSMERACIPIVIAITAEKNNE